MGKESHIQWTDATWNVARGCKKKNEDCKFCYMMRDSLNDTRYKSNEIVKTKTVFTLPDRIEPGKKIFMSSLTDWAIEEIDEFRFEVYRIIRRNENKIFQALTKRWERLVAGPHGPSILPEDWGEGWPHVWLGISAGNQKRYDEAMEYFRQVPAAIKWVSLEPLTGPITKLRLKENGIQWVVVGGESGNDNGKWRYRECEVVWIENIVNQCRAAGVPVFVKQMGTHISKMFHLTDRHGGKLEEFSRLFGMYHVKETLQQFPA